MQRQAQRITHKSVFWNVLEGRTKLFDRLTLIPFRSRQVREVHSRGNEKRSAGERLFIGRPRGCSVSVSQSLKSEGDLRLWTLGIRLVRRTGLTKCTSQRCAISRSKPVGGQVCERLGGAESKR
jgi:hypothetical protein